MANANSYDIYSYYIKYLKSKYEIIASNTEMLSYRKKFAYYNIKESIRLKRGAVELLKDKGYALALATTTNRECVDIYNNDNIYTSILDFDNLFDIILTVEDVQNKKPHPEVHYKIMENFKVSPDECLIFEDTIHRIEAGHSANIGVVGVADIDSLDSVEIKRRADFFITSLEEVICDINLCKS